MAGQRNQYIVLEMDGTRRTVIASNIQEVKRSFQVMGIPVQAIQRVSKTTTRQYNAIRG